MMLFIAGCQFLRNEKLLESDGELPVQLGEQLFFEKKLSFYGDISCATCHLPELAYTDGYRRSFNSQADRVRTNSTTLLNLASKSFYHSSDPGINSLHAAVERPFYAEHPVEMGWQLGEEEILQTINQLYSQKYGIIIDRKIVLKAIKLFLESQLSVNSLYDVYLTNKDSALFTSGQYRGMRLFFSEKTGCSNCHGGHYFNEPEAGEVFANNQYYRSKEEQDGLLAYSGKIEDKGKFRIPTLRNIALTFPYYYDGTGNSLDEVVDHYILGTRYTVVTQDSSGKDERLRKITLTGEEKRDLIDFLYTLTDTTYMDKLRLYR